MWGTYWDFNRAIFIRPHKHICMWLRLDTVYANTEQRSESHQIGYKMFFSSMDVNECIHKQPPYMRTIILPLSLKICILIISRYISWVFSNILSERDRWVTRWRAHEHRCFMLKKVAHGMVCLCESHRGLNFRDVISARLLGQGNFHFSSLQSLEQPRQWH